MIQSTAHHNTLPPDILITTQTRGRPANSRRAPGPDRGGLWCWFRKLIRIRGVSRAKVDDHLFFFVGGLLGDVACCAHGRCSAPKVSDVSRHLVDLHCLVRNNASHGAFLVSGVTSGYGRPHPYRVADSEPSVLFFRFFCCSVHIPHPNGVCVHDVSRGCPRVAAVSRRNVVQVHRLFTVQFFLAAMTFTRRWHLSAMPLPDGA
ncbi:hypothetical protein T02_2244 [Trichinella nativa]|uniref:Uncharacterized protein n=1 Tax=Trichinella nativa TaxID=6335 RepID=A0A0V1LHY5_9BILA|nr:hypothetical protein T02_2244 [Trichinella nativa]